MSFERPMGPGAEPPPVPAGTGAASVAGEGITPAMRLQILSTEHWSLLASRSLAWNEMFSRAGMFLSTLSGTIVALALVAQPTQFGEGFRIFAFVLLPVVLFIGLTTLFRMGSTNYHDAQCIIGMNRIRAGYLELAPDLERFFVNVIGIERTMSLMPKSPPIVHFVSGSPTLVMVINAVLVAVIVALVAIQLGVSTPITVGAGAGGFLLLMVLQLEQGRRAIVAAMAEHVSLFPGRPPAATD